MRSPARTQRERRPSGRRPIPSARRWPLGAALILTLNAALLPAQPPAAPEPTPRPNPARLAGAEIPLPPPDESYVNFSFDQVDIAAFVKLVGDLTGRKFAVAEDVKGKITVVSPRVSRREVYPLFLSILESAGCAVLRDGDIERVVLLAERLTPLAPVVGAEEPTPAEGVVTKVFRLKNASAAEVRKLLESRVSGGKSGAVAAVEETNHLIVTDTAASVRRIEKLVAEIDQPGTARQTEVVPLRFAGAEDLAAQINAALAEGETRAEQLRRRLPPAPEGAGLASARGANVVASPHSNSLILLGTPGQIAELRRLIALMDVESTAGRGRLNAILLKHISAEEAAKSLNALLGKPAEAKGEGPAKGRIAIEAVPASNALLVDATPSDFETVRQLVERLDQPVEQVHIEVVIAELSESDTLNLGVEMAALDLPSAVGDTVLQAGSMLSEPDKNLMSAIQNQVFPRGISVGLARGAQLDSEGKIVSGYPGIVNIDALRRDSRVKIRSNPSLMAQNNQEASVNIVNQIPVLKSTIEGGSGASRDVIQNIERIDVGIKLKLTPSVIPGGQVRMKLNPSIEAVVDPGPSGSYTPTIARRDVTTTVTVPDGQTIVIAGLTREDRTKIVQRVPLLGSLPLLGWLFRHTTDGAERTNVLIFVTPRIVSSPAAAQAVAERWERRSGLPADEQRDVPDAR